MRVAESISLLAAVIATAQGQFFDGYQNVSTSTTPVQMRLAYSGSNAMMGELSPPTGTIRTPSAKQPQPKSHGTPSRSLAAHLFITASLRDISL